MSGCTKPNEPAYAVSLSSDGNYAISSHRDNSIILWDIKKKTKSIISETGNIYSAYFIKNSHNYIWQELDNTVKVKNTDGNIIDQFENTPTYGHIISSDLSKYIYSDKGWGIFLRKNKQKPIQFKEPDGGSFGGHGKLMNLSLSKNEDTLLSSGYVFDWEPNSERTEKEIKFNEKLSLEGVTIWDISFRNIINKFPGNAAKTYATFSPDGENIISVCENGKPLFWDVKSKKLKYWLGRPGLGIWNGSEYINTNGIKLPKDYIDPGHHGGYVSAKYLTKDYFILINTYEPFAFLYHKDKQQPIKFFHLGTRPFPAVSYYVRNTAIDTAPDAGILVTGQRDGNGINVYKFNQEKLTLEKIWVTN